MLGRVFLAALVVATPCQAWDLDKYPPIPENIDISIPEKNCLKAAILTWPYMDAPGESR